MQPGGFADIDTKTPSGARVYDYMLGGTDNYVVDRIAADQTEMMMPGTKALARNNRRYMERVVRYLASECGIRQFIDNGSGLPTLNNVHHIAQTIAPKSRVVYIDNDPVVLRHQRVSALAENENTAFVLADATDVDEILAHPSGWPGKTQRPSPLNSRKSRDNGGLRNQNSFSSDAEAPTL
jgi:hypothetical protein